MAQERVVETTIRVRYAETDTMGVVYHANYLIWFEVGRGEFFRANGQDYGKWEKEGYFLPVSEAHARYHAPAHYGEEVAIRTWVEQVRSRGLTLGYEVVDTSSRQRLASGWTQHICMDLEGRARRLPSGMLKTLGVP